MAPAMVGGQMLDALVKFEQHFARVRVSDHGLDPEKAADPFPPRHLGHMMEAGRRVE
eukprot:gene29754-51790_t